VWKKFQADRVYKYSKLLLSNIKTSKHNLSMISIESIADVNVIDGDPELDPRTETIDRKSHYQAISSKWFLNPGDPESAA
jgi:hypothetical protein